MRYLAAVGAIFFAYLSLIPIALIGSTIDPACAGEQCQTGLLSDIVFTTLYTACALGLISISGTLSLYFFRPSAVGEDWIVRALIGTVIAVGLTFFALFAISSPIAAVVIAVIGAAIYLSLRRIRDAAQPPDPSSNGHHPELNGLNGHGRLNGDPRG